jgi:hypothetical protein
VQLRGCCRSDKKITIFPPGWQAGILPSRSIGPAVWRQPTQTVTWACARFSLPARCERVRSGDALGPRSVVYFFSMRHMHMNRTHHRRDPKDLPLAAPNSAPECQIKWLALGPGQHTRRPVCNWVSQLVRYRDLFILVLPPPRLFSNHTIL